MKMVMKIFIALVIVAFLLVVGLFGWVISNTHPDPLFNIGNDFPQTVTIYFNGYNMGKINSGESKLFYPNDGKILSKDNTSLLVEFKSNSGAVLFSKLYTWDELRLVLESVKGLPYWIGVGT